MPNRITGINAVSITNLESQFVAALTNEGHLLIFPLAELPALPRGKAIKSSKFRAAK